ncbi:KinB signaling pathway activation protein [Bacillus horti]|uniref:KinB signaling pathway activation protein n=2 Tax=Caldalkalibacillus horti TaxID=77523 RepID=A0ABT9VYN4_9BACI|nr:KinB signaling pathway activation protein [Bacillus horti]
MFLTTLLLGGITILATGLAIGWGDMTGGGDQASELVAAIIWMFIVGLLFSMISQMGFFAYLLVHRLGLGVFKPKLWTWIQVLLIAFVLFDLVYFRYIAFGTELDTWTQFTTLPIILLIVGLIAAFIKAKLTNSKAFIPALFFLTVVTTVEAVPAIIQNDQNWTTMMTTTILVCNLYQLLILQRLTKPIEQKA